MYVGSSNDATDARRRPRATGYALLSIEYDSMAAAIAAICSLASSLASALVEGSADSVSAPPGRSVMSSSLAAEASAPARRSGPSDDRS